MLRFLVDFTVPFTNRMGEQDMRMMKLRMKISGCFQTERGARDYAMLRSVRSMARKQGWNRIERMMKSSDESFAGLRVWPGPDAFSPGAGRRGAAVTEQKRLTPQPRQRGWLPSHGELATVDSRDFAHMS